MKEQGAVVGCSVNPKYPGFVRNPRKSGIMPTGKRLIFYCTVQVKCLVRGIEITPMNLLLAIKQSLKYGRCVSIGVPGGCFNSANFLKSPKKF